MLTQHLTNVLPAFLNQQGGLILFGIKDDTRTLIFVMNFTGIFTKEPLGEQKMHDCYGNCVTFVDGVSNQY